MVPTTQAISSEQLSLIKKTVAKDSTDDELSLFLYDCQRQGVHPLDKLIHFTKRGGRYTPITSIDFLRMQAGKTGEYAGADDGVFSGTPGAGGFACTMTVYRLVGGVRCAWTATARWQEYYPGDAAGSMWRKMPHVMLGKVSESLVLRKAFADVLHGLYTHEEMAQAEKKEPVAPISLREKLGITVLPEEVDAPVGETPKTMYAVPQVELQVVERPEPPLTVWPVGKHKGLPVSDVPSSYLEWGVNNLHTATLRLAAINELLQRKGDA
jgi:phage recombination protein Bet